MKATATKPRAKPTKSTDYPTRRWTPSEERFALENADRLTAPQIAVYVCHSAKAVRLKLMHLRRGENDPDFQPERQAVADEVVKHLAQLLARGKLKTEQAMQMVKRLDVMLNEPDARFLPRTQWTVARWLDELAP